MRVVLYHDTGVCGVVMRHMQLWFCHVIQAVVVSSCDAGGCGFVM